MKLVPNAVAAALARIARIAVPFNGRGRQFDLDEVRGPRTQRGLALPVYFDTGHSTLPRSHPHALYGQGAPWLWHTYFNDFDTMADINADATASSSWNVHLTEAGAGEAAIALADGDGGHLLLTNDAADDDRIFLQKKGESFKYEAGKPMMFGARLKVSDATQSDFLAGLMITDTTPLDVTHGIFFQKDDGDAQLDFNVEKANTQTAVANIATVVNDTFITMQWVYDGERAIHYGVNGVIKGKTVLTNAPDDEELAVCIGIQNGEAVAKTMTIDYVFAAKYMGRS